MILQGAVLLVIVTIPVFQEDRHLGFVGPCSLTDRVGGDRLSACAGIHVAVRGAGDGIGGGGCHRILV